jgi:hypothetical protein
MFKKWFQSVFWGSVSKGAWTAGSVISAIIGATTAKDHPLLRVLVPLSIFVVGFFVSNYFIYKGLMQELERVTGKLTLATAGTQIREQINFPLRRHVVVVEMLLDLRNQSAEANSVRVKGAEINVFGASLDHEQPRFLGNPKHSCSQPAGPTWNMCGKSQDQAVVQAIFVLPYSPSRIDQENVSGVIEILDIHDRIHKLGFEGALLRNPVVDG